MGKFRTVFPSRDEVRTWGRLMRGFEGATASGMFEDELEPLTEGGLIASIPMFGVDHLRQVWQAARLDQTDLQSGWFRIDEFGVFKLELTTYKFKTSLISPVRWLTNAGFLFAKDKEIASLSSALFFQKLGSSVTNTIAEVCPLVDRVLQFEWPFGHQVEVLRSVGA